MRVLDPACGSGNFLYVALQALKDLEHEVVTFAEQVGAPGFRLVGPKQFHGIELNPFARELASMVVWIGFLQWNRANGISNTQRPVLEPLENIRLHDALMNEDGTEYEWPEAEFIIGNPPFIGGKRLRSELGGVYVERLFATFAGRVPREADFVTYWLEKARGAIESDRGHRAGLIATNSIRGGANRRVLEAVKRTGDIFLAWSDEPWVLDGAAVRVSIVGFDDGSEGTRLLDGKAVPGINANLTSGLDLTVARPLTENTGRSFMGTTKVGAFEVSESTALRWLDLPNASGADNADVVRPWLNGTQLMGRPRNLWIVDFGLRSLKEASEYEVPFEHVSENVRPSRQQNNRRQYRERWWLHAEPRPALRAAIVGKDRVILTPRVSRHRVFIIADSRTVPDSRLFVIVADDALFTFGVLHSRPHETWTLAMASRHGVGNDPTYNSSTCFESFAFPEPTEAQREAVSAAARHLDQVRRHLLDTDEALTLTKLYNEITALRETRDVAARGFPLLLAHEALDAAVAAAYGWEWPMSDDEILERLLALNLERASLEAP